MGHYWSEMRGDPTQQELDENECERIVNILRKEPSSRFTVEELAFLLKSDWNEFKDWFYDSELPKAKALAAKLGIKIAS